MKCQILFSQKNKKNVIFSSPGLALLALKVKKMS